MFIPASNCLKKKSHSINDSPYLIKGIKSSIDEAERKARSLNPPRWACPDGAVCTKKPLVFTSSKSGPQGLDKVQ